MGVVTTNSLEDLEPVPLSRAIGHVATAQALLVDVLRGRSVTKAEVTAIRQAFVFVRKVFDALDERSGWNAVPNVEAIIAAGDAMAVTAEPPDRAEWRRVTDPWRPA